MRLLAVVLLLLVGGGVLWQLTRDDDKPVRTATERRGAVESVPVEDPEPDEPAPVAAHRLVGTVTGDAPLGGVRVTIEGGGECVTGEDGSYSIKVPAPSKTRIFHLRADAPDGRVGFGLGHIALNQPESKQQPIPLKPGATVVLRTVDAGGAAVAAAKIRIHELVTYPRMGPRKFARALQNTRTDGNGRLELRLATAEYRIWAGAPGFARGVHEFKLGDAREEIVVSLKEERALKVIVRDKKGQRPVEGATVYTSQRYKDYGNEPSVTDEHGEARITGLHPEDKVQLLAVGPGQPKPRPGPGLVRPVKVKPGDTEVVIEIELPRTITFEVSDGEIPVPADGTKIVVKADPGAFMQNPPAEGIMESGRLVLRNCPPATFHAIAYGPDATAARLYCHADKTEGRGIEFSKACNIDYLIRNADGTPAVGTKLAVFNPGNNLMASATTDTEGKARMEMLFGQLADVKLMTGPSGYRGMVLGTVDLRKGDITIEHVLATQRAVELLAKLEGKPGLPKGFRLWANQLQMSDVQVDNETGSYKAVAALPRSLKPGDEITMSLTVAGYRTEIAKVVLGEGDAPIRHTFDLQRGIDLLVRVKGTAPKRARFEFQKRIGERWQTIDSRNMFPRRAREEVEGGWKFLGLDAGRYRMRVARHELVLAEVELAAGAANLLELDYDLLVPVKGHVEVPEGYSVSDVRVVWEGAPRAPAMFGRAGVRPNRETGAFELLTVVGRAGTLTADHPVLSPVVGVAIEGARDDVVLRLAVGPTLRFRLPAFLKNRRLPVAVRLYASDTLEEAVFDGSASAKEQEWVVGGMRPGRYTLFVDIPNSVPLIRHDFEVKPGDNDLGELVMDKGASVRVRILVREPFVAPRIVLWAIHQGNPQFTRGLNSNGESEVVATGLIPGRYRITAGEIMGFQGAGGARIDKTIEVGTEDVEMTLDLR